MTVSVHRDATVAVVTLDRPSRRNAVDRATAAALAETFRALDDDPACSVIVLYGAGGTFCAGADLQAIAAGDLNVVAPDGDGPLGPTRLRLSKPVIAAIEGHAVAGGLELALWCDLRVAARSARLGVLCRRVGVPLIDGGTVRLPRLIGLSRALDLILTGRLVEADEAAQIGLVNRVVPDGDALSAAVSLAHELAAFPQLCLRADRASALSAFDLPEAEALRAEVIGGLAVLASGETVAGAARFVAGAGRHGAAMKAP